jgi:uncharacterized protein YndB with AHSA1/START domain
MSDDLYAPAVDISAQALVPFPVERVRREVRDLGTYPGWLSIVRKALAESEGAWLVELSGRVGPITRTKRVRMVRVADDSGLVRFERREEDGRSHSPWVLTVGLATVDEGTTVTVDLHYGGKRRVPLIDVVLAPEVRRAGARLAACIAAGPDTAASG